MLASTHFRSLMALGALIPLLSAAVGAEPLTSIPNPRTRDGTWVTDTPGILRTDTIASLNSTIDEFERLQSGWGNRRSRTDTLTGSSK